MKKGGKMDVKHVEGKDVGKIFLYAISTCAWCKKTKRLLNDLGLDYYYVDVDLLDEDDKKKTKEEVKKWNPQFSFPTLIINDEKCIIGFDEDKIKGIGEK
jgi:glutaredoxin-like protein NrdH